MKKVRMSDYYKNVSINSIVASKNSYNIYYTDHCGENHRSSFNKKLISSALQFIRIKEKIVNREDIAEHQVFLEDYMKCNTEKNGKCYIKSPAREGFGY